MNKLLSGRTAWRIHRGTRAGLLVDGRDYYLSFFEAARRARRSILLLGWQFDSDVKLVRGDDLPRGSDPADVELLRFLDNLCRARPELEVRVLAWDHSVVFALERQAFQKLVFDATTCKRFHFHWDSTVPLGGSHHQKVAIVDGRIGFTGSQDLCQERWDVSSHLPRHPLRVARSGSGYKPYHEVQVALAGPPVRSLVELFVRRWKDATGEDLDVPKLVYAGPVGWGEARIPLTLAMPRATAALSRTVPPGEGREAAKEIRELYVRAIHGAERMIYIETQYLTSCVVRQALLERLRRGPPIDVVIVLPHKPERFKEELTVTLPQALTLRTLDETARTHGHRLGVYNVAAKDEHGDDVNVYIHSKLMIVDDRFLTLGSANLTNRSMSVDSELNVSWEAAPDDNVLHAAIRRARARLLLEHLGEAASARIVARPEQLVTRLDATIEDGVGRLRRHRIDGEEPGAFARAVQELACEVLDPTDGAEPIALPARPSAA